MLFNFTQNYFKLFFKWFWKFNAQFHKLFFFISLNGKPFNFICLNTCMCECASLTRMHLHTVHSEIKKKFEFALIIFHWQTMCSSKFHLSIFAHCWMRHSVYTFTKNTHLFWYKIHLMNFSICLSKFPSKTEGMHN